MALVLALKLQQEGNSLVSSFRETRSGTTIKYSAHYNGINFLYGPFIKHFLHNSFA